MLKRLAGAAAIAALAIMPALVPAAAQDSGAETVATTSQNPVVATVNGTDITTADVAFALEALGQSLQRVPQQNRRQVVVDMLIDMALIADAAEEAGLADDPAVEQRVDYYRKQALRDLYIEKLVAEEVTDEAVRQRYEEETADMEPTEEVNARHILVESEEEARTLIEELEGGADFAALAEEHSQDPGSAARGGSLGFFSRGQMVPAFEEAAFALEEGEITDAPVQSQFGYHVIKVDEKRTRSVPSFEEVSDRIRQIMVRDAFLKEIERLKETAEIEKTAAE